MEPGRIGERRMCSKRWSALGRVRRSTERNDVSTIPRARPWEGEDEKGRWAPVPERFQKRWSFLPRAFLHQKRRFHFRFILRGHYLPHAPPRVHPISSISSLPHDSAGRSAVSRISSSPHRVGTLLSPQKARIHRRDREPLTACTARLQMEMEDRHAGRRGGGHWRHCTAQCECAGGPRHR
jgi:hypothetical protein